MTKRDFLSMADLTAPETDRLLARARNMKTRRRPLTQLAGKSVGLIFQKPSTRTAVSFAVALYELGGLALTLDAHQLQIQRGETMADTARTLSRYLAGIVIRAHRHNDVEELARHASAPVINGLTDREHPCQVLADLLTLMESFQLSRLAGARDLQLLYVGDGNNVAHSWMLGAGVLGLNLTVASPRGYQPDPAVRLRAEALARASGGRVRVTEDPRAAARGAHMIYTDVWTSMGQESETARRRKIFRPYQVNAALVALADPRVVVMHCLPAHRGEEITADVLEGPRSVVFDQAENRLHAQKAVLLSFVGGSSAP